MWISCLGQLKMDFFYRFFRGAPTLTFPPPPDNRFYVFDKRPGYSFYQNCIFTISLLSEFQKDVNFPFVIVPWVHILPSGHQAKKKFQQKILLQG